MANTSATVQNNDLSTWVSQDNKQKPSASNSAYSLVWYPAISQGIQPYVVGRTKDANLTEGPSGLTPKINGNYTNTFLQTSYTRQLILPFNTMPCFAQEYSPQLTNKVVQYNTLAGNTLITFGEGVRKIGLKIVIIKAGIHWIPFNSMLEAMTLLSGNQARYSGALVLYGFDRAKPGTARKYKVIIEQLNPVYRADKNNVIEYDLSMLVAQDYSMDQSSDWGRLGSTPKIVAKIAPKGKK